MFLHLAEIINLLTTHRFKNITEAYYQCWSKNILTICVTVWWASFWPALMMCSSRLLHEQGKNNVLYWI